MTETDPVAAASDSLAVLLRSAPLDSARSRGQEVYVAMMLFAAACIDHDMIQTAADILAFLLQDDYAGDTIRDKAAARFDELEQRICPRVILDARSFAEGMDLPTMLEYLLDLLTPEST